MQPTQINLQFSRLNNLVMIDMKIELKVMLVHLKIEFQN